MHTRRLTLGVLLATLGIQIPALAGESPRSTNPPALSADGAVLLAPAATTAASRRDGPGVAASPAVGVRPAPKAPATRSPGTGRDVSRADVCGVRLYMSVDEARAALGRSLPGESAWHDTRIPCADERGRAGAGQGSCLAASVLGGAAGVVLRFVEDLPSRPHRSIVSEVVLSREPVRADSKPLFHQALLRKYGVPDLSDPTGMQWGQVTRDAGQVVLLRTLPMLESSNDEIIRLSDTGLEERKAALAEARSPPRLTGPGHLQASAAPSSR